MPEVADPEAVALALAPAERRSSPAVMVTGNRLSEMSLMTPVKVPGSLASGPASVSTQLAVSDVILQSTSMVLQAVSITGQPADLLVSVSLFSHHTHKIYKR